MTGRTKRVIAVVEVVLIIVAFILINQAPQFYGRMFIWWLVLIYGILISISFIISLISNED